MASDDLVTRRQSGLQRSLSEHQPAISLACPSVIVSYIFGAVVALIMTWALTGMSVVHPWRDPSASTQRSTRIRTPASSCAGPTGLGLETGIPYIAVISLIYLFVRKRHGVPVVEGMPPEVEN